MRYRHLEHAVTRFPIPSAGRRSGRPDHQNRPNPTLQLDRRASVQHQTRGFGQPDAAVLNGVEVVDHGEGTVLKHAHLDADLGTCPTLVALTLVAIVSEVVHDQRPRLGVDGGRTFQWKTCWPSIDSVDTGVVMALR